MHRQIEEELCEREGQGKLFITKWSINIYVCIH